MWVRIPPRSLLNPGRRCTRCYVTSAVRDQVTGAIEGWGLLNLFG